MARTKEELEGIKMKMQELKETLRELSDDELAQVTGGSDIGPSRKDISLMES